MSNVVKSEVVTPQSQALSGTEIMSIAQHFYNSGLFTDTKSEAQAVVKIMAGRELGFEPFASMQVFDIIQGKVVLKPIGIASKIKASGKYNYLIVKQEIDECKIEFFEHGVSIGFSSFSLQDAKKMNLEHKDNWRKQPAVMLYNRAMSKGARQFCPDAFAGIAVYTDGEIEGFPTPEPSQQQGAVQQGMTHEEAKPVSYNKQIADAVKAAGIDSDVFVEYLKAVWMIEKLKGTTVKQEEFEGIMVAIAKGQEFLERMIANAKASDDDEYGENSEAEKELFTEN